MRLTFGLVFGSLAATVTSLAIPAPQGPSEAAGIAERDASLLDTRHLSEAAIIVGAAEALVTDENAISCFLDKVSGSEFTSKKSFHEAADIVYAIAQASETAIDLLSEYVTIASNSTVEEQNPEITNLLLELTQLNWDTQQDEIQDIVNEINFGNGANVESRCNVLLPAFDEYITEASGVLEGISPSKTVLSGLSVNVPKSCSRTVVSRSVLE